jgi:hypothetical protein
MTPVSKVMVVVLETDSRVGKDAAQRVETAERSSGDLLQMNVGEHKHDPASARRGIPHRIT